MKTSILSFLLLLSPLLLLGQVSNDECRFATFFPSVDNFCSDSDAFSNIGAQPDPQVDNSCFINFENGVWFSFVPREPAVLIQVFGGGDNDGLITRPQITLFSRCGEYLQCSPGKDNASDELTVDGLVIGQTHFIMIDSPEGSEGTFGLCINDFVAPRFPESDCGSAVVLCDTEPFSLENLNSAGRDLNEVDGTCIQEEFASSWYTWTCDVSGTLTMDLIPNNNATNQITDDLDWAIYELPNGVEDCTDKQLLRCMASGENVGQPFSSWNMCNGPTGMRAGESDTEEQPGCASGDNNYVAPINMVSGRSYALIVNNFSRSGLGFAIEFGGTGTFLGPEPAFDLSAVQAFECDKTITFSNESFSNTDEIISWEWNFGGGADISFAEGEGPFDIVYESFGDKIAALTVETSRGCRVTRVLDFFIEPCCADTSSLSVDTDVTNVSCGGESSGVVIGIGRSGAPEYSFSLDSESFQPNPRFTGLAAGEYDIFVRDIKGCINRATFVVDEPEPLLVDAGRDTTINLGETIQIFASHTPPGSSVLYTWLVTDSLDCVNCPDPISRTPGTTSYVIQVQDENGCIALDTITIRVNVVRPIHAPNIFSPNEDGQNDFFGLFGGSAVARVEELTVFDRWGGKVYQGRGLEINRYDVGWDGTLDGNKLETGVYTWIAQVLFIDGVLVPFTGDITLLR